MTVMARRCLVVLLVISLCAGTLAATERPVAAQEEYTIGLSVPSLSFTWFVFIKDNLQERAAQDPDVNLEVFDGRNDVGKQISDVEDMITRNFDGILISPIDVKGLIPAVEKAQDANLPMITFDRKVTGKDYGQGSLIGHVGADNVEGGRVAALNLVARLDGVGNVVEITGTPGSSPAIDRSKGFNDVIESFPEMEVVARQTGEFRRSEGRNVMEDIITSQPDFDAVFAANDGMLMGALSAIEAADISTDDVLLQGFDAIPDTLEAVERGDVTGTIEQHPAGQIERAYSILMNYVRNGERPEEAVQFLTPTLILKSNLSRAEKYEG